MNDQYPTSGDYANASADKAHDKIKELEATIEWMAAKLGLEIPRKPAPVPCSFAEIIAEHYRNVIPASGPTAEQRKNGDYSGWDEQQRARGGR